MFKPIINKAVDKNVYETTDVSEIEDGLKADNNPVIQTVTVWKNTDSKFYAPGMLIRVKNGKGILRETFMENEGVSSYVTLMFGDEPLFQLQGGEYFCPTCQKIVRSGYGLRQTEEFKVDKLNKPRSEVTLEETVNELKPLLGLLADNYYLILDTDLYPTDGNGHLFWEVPNDDVCLAGSCLYYSNDGHWGKLRPHFTVATQSIRNLNTERVEYYRKHSDCRTVAYYMDGYMTALIDGHHKAFAAALEHQKVAAIVIVPCTLSRTVVDGGNYKESIGFGDIKFDKRIYNIESTVTGYFGVKMSSSEMENINAKIPKTVLPIHLPYDIKGLVNYYPGVEEVFNIDEAGKITDAWIDKILAGEYKCTQEEICRLLKAMGGLKHKRLLEVADYFFRINEYTAYPKYHNMEMITDMVEALVGMPRTEKSENYLIDMMVELETEYPYIAGKILDCL